MQTVIDNENRKINDLIPSLNQDREKRPNAEITDQLQKDFKIYLPELGALMEPFHYRLNQTANHTRCS